MKLVEQSVEAWGVCPSEEEKLLDWIERAGRTAYKSEDKMTPDSARAFVSKLKGSGHLSVLEHSNIVVNLANNTWEKDFYGVLKGRAAYHPVHVSDSGLLVAGNVRAWIETLQSGEVDGSYPGIRVNLGTEYSCLFDLPEPEVVAFFTRHLWGRVHVVDASVALRYFLEKPESDLPVFTFKIVTDRGITHELVRHRVFSFTQESTRYVDYGGRGVVLINPREYDITKFPLDCEAAYGNMRYHGLSPQIARDVLPNLTKSEIVISGRWSGWKHFIRLREAKAAHPRIREIAQEVRAYFEDLGLKVEG